MTMDSEQAHRRRVEYGRAAIVGFAVMLLFSAPFWNVKGDDAFITFRFAENLARFGQLAYNLGEPVYGFTSPAWLGLLSLCLKVTGDMYLASAIASSFALVGLALALWALAIRSRLKPWLLVCVMAFVGLDGWFARWAFSGQEIVFKIAIAALVIERTLAALEDGRWITSATLGLVFVVAGLTRPELAVLLVPLCIVWLLASGRRTQALVAGALFAAGYGAWMLAAYQMFGWAVPHTILVKTLGARGSVLALAGKMLAIVGPALLGPAVLALSAKLPSAARIRMRDVPSLLRAQADWALPLAWGIGVLVGYVISGAYIASMYTLIGTPFVVFGLVRFAQEQGFAPEHKRGLVRVALAIGIVGYVGFVVFMGRFSWIAGDRYAAGDDRAYVAFCEWVDATVPADARIVTAELGILGWIANRYMIDAAGIATPSLLSGGPLADYRPDYVCLYGPTVRQFRDLTLSPLREVRFVRVGGLNALRGEEETATLYEVVGR